MKEDSKREDKVRATALKVLSRGMSAASIVVNNKCNLACKHCYIYEPERQNDMPSEFFRKIDPKYFSKETALAIARDLNGLAYLVTIPAMEPFLSKDSTETTLSVAKESSQRASVSIITNATMVPYWLDEKRVKELTNHVEFLSVSLEGEKKMHDRIRGEGNFDRAIKGIEHLINLGYPPERITLQTCIQPLLADPFQQTSNILDIANHLNVGKASFTAFISPMLSQRPTLEDVGKHKETYVHVIEAIKKAESKGIRNKLISIYGTYESPAAVASLNRTIKELADNYPELAIEFNAFETSYFLRHPEIKNLDVRIEVAPLSIEIPCYPRIAAVENPNKLINIVDTDVPIYQGAHITRCFAYQVDEIPIADWTAGLFPFMERRLVHEGEELIKTLRIPNKDEVIHVDPNKPRTKKEYFEEVFRESIRYNLQKTAVLNEIYEELDLYTYYEDDKKRMKEINKNKKLAQKLIAFCIKNFDDFNPE